MLIGVTEARAKVGSIQVTPELLNDPELFAKFQAAQGELTSALKSLFAVDRELSAAEVGPELPRPAGADRGHGEPHHRGAQPLHPGGAELQLTVRQFPVNLTAKMFGFQVKPNFTVANEAQISTAPTVSFDTATPGAAGAGALGTARHAMIRGHSRAALLAGFALLWLLGLGTAAARAGPAADPQARRARHRPHRHAHRRAAGQRSSRSSPRSRRPRARSWRVLIVPTTQPEEIEQYSHPRGRAVEARAREGR